MSIRIVSGSCVTDGEHFVYGGSAEDARWFAAEIERLQRCADVLEIAETALRDLGRRNDCISDFLGWRERSYTCWCHFGSESADPAKHEPNCNQARDVLIAIDAAKNPEAQR